jgi:hypothetical protein
MNLPQLNSALGNWQYPITLIKITQNIVDHQVVNIEEQLNFQGVIQPLSPKELVIKPISERSWEWSQIHTEKTIAISTNDKIKYNDKIYKVMLQNDYSPYGYIEYHLVKDYE